MKKPSQAMLRPRRRQNLPVRLRLCPRLAKVYAYPGSMAAAPSGFKYLRPGHAYQQLVSGGAGWLYVDGLGKGGRAPEEDRGTLLGSQCEVNLLMTFTKSYLNAVEKSLAPQSVSCEGMFWKAHFTMEGETIYGEYQGMEKSLMVFRRGGRSKSNTSPIPYSEIQSYCVVTAKEGKTRARVDDSYSVYRVS